MMLTATLTDNVQTFDPDAIPTEVAMVMSALEAGSHAMEERRMTRRAPFRAATRLRLFRDQPVTPGWKLYTRDVNRRGLGFITRHRLPLGYGRAEMIVTEPARDSPGAIAEALSSAWPPSVLSIVSEPTARTANARATDAWRGTSGKWPVAA